MKLYGILCIIIAVIMLLTPLSAVSFGENKAKTEKSTELSELITEIETEESSKDKDTISVFMTSKNKTEEMEMRDYIIGAVAAEMPAAYEEEALKAQALAAVTYAQYMKVNGNGEDLNGADISDSSDTCQGYITKAQMQEKWGDAYTKYYQKIADAVDAVIDKVITYDGEPIMATYHAISFGYTESAENIWGKDIPYLVSVESKGDTDSTRYISTVTITDDDLKGLTGNENITGDGSDIKINSTSDTGAVLSVTVCGEDMSGMKARELLSLRSPCFTVGYEDGEYTITVNGYGHGVGMSQFGADYYAKQGMTYDEIIKHYYQGVEIETR